jgi:hypothetical protein
MARRSEGFELVVIGASLVLILSFQTVWNIVLEAWIKAQLEVYMGPLAAEIIERTGAIIVPLGLAAAIVHTLYRYLRDELRAGLTPSSLEILFNPNDERCVRWEHSSDDTHAIVRYRVGIHNTGPTTLFSLTVRAHESRFVQKVIAVAHRVPAETETPIIWRADALEPQATEYVELFGMDDRDAAVLRNAYIFHIEARARDASPEIAEFKYDPRRSKGLRRLR